MALPPDPILFKYLQFTAHYGELQFKNNSAYNVYQCSLKVGLHSPIWFLELAPLPISLQSIEFFAASSQNMEQTYLTTKIL